MVAPLWSMARPAWHVGKWLQNLQSVIRYRFPSFSFCIPSLAKCNRSRPRVSAILVLTGEDSTLYWILSSSEAVRQGTISSASPDVEDSGHNHIGPLRSSTPFSFSLLFIIKSLFFQSRGSIRVFLHHRSLKFSLFIRSIYLFIFGTYFIVIGNVESGKTPIRLWWC